MNIPIRIAAAALGTWMLAFVFTAFYIVITGKNSITELPLWWSCSVFGPLALLLVGVIGGAGVILILLALGIVSK